MAGSCPSGVRTWTPGTGFTEITDLIDTGFVMSLFTQWRNDNDTTPNATLSGTGTPPYGVIALELVASATASKTLTTLGVG